MNSNIKIIASDLDSTLLLDNKQISDFTREVLDEINKYGIYFIPCSARNFEELPTVITSIPFVKYAVCANGATLVDLHENKIILEHLIDISTALLILETAECPYWTVSSNGKLFTSRKVSDDRKSLNIPDSYFEEFGHVQVFIDDYHELLDDHANINKIHFICPQKKTELTQTLKKLSGISVTSSHKNNIEVIHKDSSKGLGLEYFMDLIGCKSDQVIAFGDNSNDVEMLRKVDYRCAVSNAVDELKKIANFQTESNENDGVAKFINAFLALGLE